MNFEEIAKKEMAELAERLKSYKTAEKPPAELGRNLNTLEDCRRWILHPSNWFEGQIYIVKWDGIVPKLSSYHGERLIRETWDTGMYEVLIRHQRGLKAGRKEDDEPKDTAE